MDLPPQWSLLMARPAPTPLQRQLHRVSRRLFWQTLLGCLVWCWSGALLLTAVWFLLQPHLLAEPPAWLRGALAGGALFGGTVLAVILAWRWTPSAVTAALLLDQKFELKERVTTTLTLGPGLEQSPAGQALLADVNQQVDKLDVGARFPVRLAWTDLVPPVATAVLALLAFYYQPAQSQANVRPQAAADEKPANAEEIKEKLDKLRKQVRKEDPKERKAAEKVKQIEADLDKIANKPHEKKNDLRERVKELSAVEQEARRREKQLAEKGQAVKEQLQQLNQMTKGTESQEGPAKEMQKSLSQGNIEKSKEEMKKLAEKLEKNQLSRKEKDQLSKQMNDLQKKLERAAEQHRKNEENRLQQQHKEGKIDAETLKRELSKLKQDQQKMQDLAKQMQKVQNALKQGQSQQAAQSLKEAGQQLQNMKLNEQEMKEMRDLREQMERLEEAKGACCKGMGEGEREGQGEGEGKGKNEETLQAANDGQGQQEGQGGDKNQSGNGMGKTASKFPGGRRPETKNGPSNPLERQARTQFDPKGQKILEGYVPGRAIKGKSPAEISGEIKRASQEAPEEIEQQRIPREYRDSAKGYFRNLSGQKDGKK
jgi:hypothetical protein